LADDEITSATVGLVLDSLDDIHCITEAKHKDQVQNIDQIKKLKGDIEHKAHRSWKESSLPGINV
jgi:hypothetical protein